MDLPSGVDADTGVVAGAAIQADVTVTFGTVKPGLLVDPGASHAGVVELIDIGLAPFLGPPDLTALQAADVGAALPRPPADSDKYRRGVAGLVAGSQRYTGAAALAVGGALRGGAGMVRLVSAEHAVAVVRVLWPEAVITVTGPGPASEDIPAAGRVQAWVAGPGMGTDDDARERLAAVLASDVPVLVDADGLTLLAADRGLLDRAAPTLLTPHAGELGRLLGADPADIEARRLEHARRAAAELGATVLLKGSTTVIAGAGRRAGVGQPRPGRPGWPRPGPGTCCPGWPARCWPRAWRSARRPRPRPTCTAWPPGWPRPAPGSGPGRPDRPERHATQPGTGRAGGRRCRARRPRSRRRT